MAGKAGSLTIKTKSRDGKVEISFRDTGPGISKDHLPKLFDPFFTTKETGKGTGLGLAISYGIIQSHGGEIKVESEEGNGAIFRIRLPSIPEIRNPPDGPLRLLRVCLRSSCRNGHG